MKCLHSTISGSSIIYLRAQIRAKSVSSSFENRTSRGTKSKQNKDDSLSVHSERFFVFIPISERDKFAIKYAINTLQLKSDCKSVAKSFISYSCTHSVKFNCPERRADVNGLSCNKFFHQSNSLFV